MITRLFRSSKLNDSANSPYDTGPHNFCEYWKKNLVYDSFSEVSDIPAKEVCPWPMKKYTIDGFRVQTEIIPLFFEGDFRNELRLLQNGELLNGFRVDINIISF